MADPRLDTPITIDGDDFRLRYTHTALSMAEKLTGKTMPHLAAVLFGGGASMTDVACLVCAGLEGARLKYRYGGKPWTLQATLDLLDAADSFDSYAKPVADCLDATLARWFPQEQEPSDPQKAAGNGTTNSEPPSEQASTSTGSGS
jgi:hypothetical protein